MWPHSFISKSIFWRIFFTFWLTSLGIMLVTSYIIINNIEKKQITHRYNTSIENHARNIIHAIQQQKLTHNDNDKNARRKPQISIYNNKNNIVFGQEKLRQQKNTFTSRITADNGETFTVYAKAPRIPFFVRDTIQKINTLQFILIFFASSIMSVILSFSITKPLKKLSEFSQKYNHDKSKIALNKEILSRPDELGRLANDILGMTQELENTLDEQKQLLHYVSHEIRAPLTRLQIAAAIIEQDTNTTKNTQRIHDECQNIDTLIQQILNYSRSGKTEYQKEFIDFDSFITPILDNLSINYPARKINIIKHKHPITLHIYTLLFASTIENILNNACKYTQSESEIDISVDENNDCTILEIRDYGPGINEHELQKVFQPFYRAGEKMHTDGFGLGLSIAKKNIEKHAGSLTMANHSDGGLIVRCSIPVK